MMETISGRETDESHPELQTQAALTNDHKLVIFDGEGGESYISAGHGSWVEVG